MAYGIVAGTAGQDMAMEGSCVIPHEHRFNPTFKGALALIGIFFFYMLERLMTIFSQRKAAKKQAKKLKLKAKEDLDKKPGLSDDDDEDEDEDEEVRYRGPSDHVCRVVNCSCADIPELLKERQKEEEQEDEERGPLKSSSYSTDSSSEPKNNNKIQRNGKLPPVEVKVNGGGQGHGHGHSDGVAEDGEGVGSMAWIVIMGDMIHNFCDGLAIGAAFSQSLAGGLSTSIAIVWHELPHELGDFAMCLRAGMSVRQAMFYNLLASVLAFIGMVIGVFAGALPSVSMWIFALAGGNFMYIALVDMLPELTHFKAPTLKRELFVLFLQAIGMFSGVILLTGVAIYETDATF